MALMTITQFMTGIKNWVLGKIENITALIPSQATSSNQLADKAFVNSSIATATATFRGTYNVVSDLSLSYNATHAQIQTALGSAISTADNNDYAFVQIPTADATPTQIAKTEKYKFNGTVWAFEYELNSSGFTASQWAAINSGATLELIGKLQALPTNAELVALLEGKQNVIADLADIRSGATAGSTAVQPNTLAAALVQTIAEAGVFDVTANNDGATFDDLEDLLSDEHLDTLIPTAVRAPGMAIKFVLTSDNSYHRFNLLTDTFSTDVDDWQEEVTQTALENGDIIPAMAKTLEDWKDQKALNKEDTYTEAVRTSGGNIPLETTEGSKPVSIKPVTDWTAKLLFNGSYNMLNAAKWGHDNNKLDVGDYEIGGGACYFLVPKLTLGEFGTAAENNGLLFTDSEGNNVTPTSVKFQPLANGAPTSSSSGTAINPTTVSFNNNTYSVYETSGAGWLVVEFGGSYTMNNICAHIAWEDWYEKYVGLDQNPATNPEAAIGVLMLESFLALGHADKKLYVISEATRDYVEFGDTQATLHQVVDIKTTQASDWTNTQVDEGIYHHTASVGNLMKSNGAAILLDGTEVEVSGTTVSFMDANSTVSGDKLYIKYERATESVVTKAYTDAVFSGSNIDTTTGKLNINDCSIEAQVGVSGTAEVTMRYALNIVDAVAINASVNVPELQKNIANHEKRIENLEENAVMSGSYDASVRVGLADNLSGEDAVEEQFVRHQTGEVNGVSSASSGQANLVMLKGESNVWNQLCNISSTDLSKTESGITCVDNRDGSYTITGTATANVSIWITSNRRDVGDKMFFFGLNTGSKIKFGYGGSGTYANYGIGIIDGGYGPVGLLIQKNAVFSSPTTIYPAFINLTKLGYPNIRSITPTVAQVKKWLSNHINRGSCDYYPYTDFILKNSLFLGLKTTGRNWLKVSGGLAKANLIGGKTYVIGGTMTAVKVDGETITPTAHGDYYEYTATNDCEMQITGYGDDTFVYIANDERGYAYEQYKERTYNLAYNRIYGKLNGEGNYVQISTNGLRSTLEVADVVNLKARKAVINVGVRDYQSGDWSDTSVITDGTTTYYALSTPLTYTDLMYDHSVAGDGSQLLPLQELNVLVDEDGTEQQTLPQDGDNVTSMSAGVTMVYAYNAKGKIKALETQVAALQTLVNSLTNSAALGSGTSADIGGSLNIENGEYKFNANT